MKHTTFIHWDESHEELHVDLALSKSGIIKADMYDCTGRCIVHVLDKVCKTGELKIVKKIKNIASGIYFMKIFCNESGCNVIRFSVN